MRLRRLLPAILGVACASGALAPAAHAQAPRRTLYVSVVDDSGAPVPDLGPSDFIVREDNVAREVLEAEPAAAPMQIALLVDNSQAAAPYIKDLRDGLESFCTAMTRPTDSGAHNQIAIIGIADRPTILADYTTDLAALKKGIGRIFAQPGSGMTLLDAVYETSQGFIKRGADRPVIVAVTTEATEFGNRLHTEVLTMLKNANARFVSLLVGRGDIGFSGEARERALLIDVGTSDTGGWRENLLTELALKPALDKLANQLSHQYRVTYAHPDSLIPPEKVTVSMKRPGLTARVRLVQPLGGERP